MADRTYQPGGDAKAISEIAKTHFSGDYAKMFEHHGWPERGAGMMRKGRPAWSKPMGACAPSRPISARTRHNGTGHSAHFGDKALTPRDAIGRGQVWLRPFGNFSPADQAYMGFAKARTRDAFIDRMQDGALVVVWTRQTRGEKEWRGLFRGVLQLERRAVSAVSCSSAKGEMLRKGSDREFEFAVPVTRAWEADPADKRAMSRIIPSMWPQLTQTIGTYSGLIDPGEVVNIESLRIKEVDVYGHPPVASRPFEPISKVFP